MNLRGTDLDIRHAHTCRCGNTYFKLTTLQNKCVKCLAAKGKKIRDKHERKEWRKRLEKNKSRSDYVEEAQEAFNAYIRERDQELPCISCNRFHKGQWHAGHYRGTRAAPELRFDLSNCHKQCKPCNHDLSGNVVEYRINLVKKIGQEKVEWIEGPHTPKKYTIEDLKALKAKYRALTKQLKPLGE